MPQIEQVNIVGDMNNYYSGTIVTHDGQPAKVIEFFQHNNTLKAYVNKLPQSGHWAEHVEVEASSLDFSMPRLGFVSYRGCWFYLSRNPQRRMRKGFHPDLIKIGIIGGNNHESSHLPLMDRVVVSQLWYGNDHRVSHDVIIHNDTLYFELDAVAHIQGENVQLVEGKEKLGEYACKLWHNNSESNN